MSLVKRFAHGVDRHTRYQAGEEEPGETNPDRKCARDGLARYDISVTNGEAGGESEIERVTDGPALDKASKQAQGNLNRHNYRQYRPRDMKGMAKGQDKAPLHGLWCQPVHMHSLISVNRLKADFSFAGVALSSGSIRWAFCGPNPVSVLL
jgi:hypothetical protein